MLLSQQYDGSLLSPTYNDQAQERKSTGEGTVRNQVVYFVFEAIK